MADNNQQPKEGPTEAAQPQPPAKSSLAKKILLIGIPVFLLQTVAVYFLTVKFIYPATVNKLPAASSEEKKAPVEPEEQQIFVVKDLIINPAGTNGTRFLLTTIGFETPSAESKKELELKEVQIRDLLNTILTSKGLDILIDAKEKDNLRKEITEKTNGMLKSGKLKNVYFSKFIIQ